MYNQASIYKGCGVYNLGDDASTELPANTLRFMFSKSDYDPTEAGVGSSGTWAKKTEFPNANVWDWTNEATDWSNSFKGAFPDTDNEVRVIAAGDTSGVTDIRNMFAGIFTNWPYQSSYSLTTRNNIVSCVPFDVSSCADFRQVFCGTCLKDVVKFRFNNLLTISGVAALFADSYLTEADINFYDISANASGLFSRCAKLTKVSLKGVENLTSLSGVFYSCRPELREIIVDGELINNTTIQTFAQNAFQVTKIQLKSTKDGLNMQAALNGCRSLTDLSIQVGKPNRVDYLFAACYSLKQLPLIDTSACAHAEYMMVDCRSAETIPDFDVSSVTNAKQMCSNMYKAKYGILEMYNKLLARGSAITDHTDCFLNCGRDTPEGRAALAQIPMSWGGLAEG